MKLETLGPVALALYLAMLLAVAEFARRAKRDASPADHFLASRDLGTWVLFLTLYATAYSGNSLLGYPGEAYRRGLLVGDPGDRLHDRRSSSSFHILVPQAAAGCRSTRGIS